jgi:hypothetical protein
VLRALGWTVPYLIAGFAAPFIFKNAPNNQIAGHYAGTLFFLAGVWACVLSFKHYFPLSASLFLIFVLVLQIIFWSWRFFNATPLKEAVLLGLPGPLWHGLLTGLYFAVALTLFVSELRRIE